MSEHTPGPWRAVAWHIDMGPNDDSMSGLGWDIEGPPEPQLRGQFAKAADAHLVAAAPELLEACEMGMPNAQGQPLWDGPTLLRELARGLGDSPFDTPLILALCRKAAAEEAAIARARGQEVRA